MSAAEAARRYADFFENLTAEIPVASYAQVFEPDAAFEDPFHKLSGIDAIYGVFQKMFATLTEPKFAVDEIVENGGVAYLRWEFSYRRSPGAPPAFFEGVSRVQFSADGKATSHIDYWDAAGNVYANIPLLGPLLVFLRRRIGAQ